MHRVRSYSLTQGLWLLYEEWGDLRDHHRVLLLFEDERRVRIPPHFAERLKEASHHGK